MRRSLLLLPLLAACQQPVAPAIDWTGRSETELVASQGVPDRVYEAEGRRFLAYESRVAGSAPAVTPSIGLGVGRFSGGWGSGTALGTGLGLSFGGLGGSPQPCTITHEVREGRIVATTRQGAGCAG